MSQNRHAAEAQGIITGNAASSLGHETADAQHITVHIEANTQATLALAYEQRTANLMALFGEGFSGRGINYGGLEKQILERLGL